MDKINETKLSLLFNEADARISNAERIAARQKKKEEMLQTLKKYEKEEKTEDIANAIISLVNGILSTAKKNTGLIEEISDKLGTLNENDGCFFKSTYNLDEEGLTIILDYSREFFDKAIYGGTCFLGVYGKRYDPNDYETKEDWEYWHDFHVEREPFYYNYLIELLNEYGITLSRINGKYNDGMVWKHYDFVIIKASRVPDISQQHHQNM